MRLKSPRYSQMSFNNPEEATPVPIAGDAAIATIATGHGRLIPLIILDTTQRPDLTEVIRAQTHFPEGDVVIQWGAMPKRLGHVALFLQFRRPIERAAIIEFNIMKQGILVEHVLISQALYIQAGKPGDRLIHDLELPKMILEVPDTGFRTYWDKIYLKAIVERMVREGLGRQQAKAASRTYVEKIRELAQFRMKSRGAGG